MRGKTHLYQVTKCITSFEYNHSNARVLAIIISKFNDKLNTKTEQVGGQFVTTYSFNKAHKKFGKQSLNSAIKEMAELHNRECFKPIHKKDLIKIGRK